jgi:hypothetical protein
MKSSTPSSWIAKTLTGRSGSRHHSSSDNYDQYNDNSFSQQQQPQYNSQSSLSKSASSSSRPLSPGAYTDPRSAPKPPVPPKSANVYLGPGRAPSSASLRSRHSDHSSSAPSYNNSNYHNSNNAPPLPDTASSIHPYSMTAKNSSNVLGHRDDDDDERECPVCLEPLSFSFRLQGEKAHIVPECGHALHEVHTSPYINTVSIYIG